MRRTVLREFLGDTPDGGYHYDMSDGTRLKLMRSIASSMAFGDERKSGAILGSLAWISTHL